MALIMSGIFQWNILVEYSSGSFRVPALRIGWIDFLFDYIQSISHGFFAMLNIMVQQIKFKWFQVPA